MSQRCLWAITITAAALYAAGITLTVLPILTHR